MIHRIKKLAFFKRLRTRPWYCRFRMRFPGSGQQYFQDPANIDDAEIVRMEWPVDVQKPKVGVVRDFGPYPLWTKFCRFLRNNSFDYDIYDIHSHSWLKQAEDFDVIVGIWSCEASHLQELREKYHFLETYLGKSTFPSSAHAFLYEDKKLESYIASAHGVPFARTYISNSKEDALRLVQEIRYPVVSKLIPSSASIGIELVKNRHQAEKIVKKAFSNFGRKTHFPYARQKDYVYFQDFIPNDGYDIRVMVVRNMVFGYYRKAPHGDFRASGMNLVEKRDLPRPAIALALRLNQVIKSPMLVVDILHGLDGKYYIIEYSPACQMETPEQFHLKGVPGMLVCDNTGNCRFEPHRYWVHELALREFFLADYLPNKHPEKSPMLCEASS